MGKYLRDLSIYVPPSAEDEANAVHPSTNFLDTLYLDSLPQVFTNGVSKVVVTPCRVAPAEGPVKLIGRNPDILQVTEVFDFDAYVEAEKERRNRMALDFLQAGLLEVADARGWDRAPFEAAYATVLAKNLVNYRPWSKPVTSPSRRLKAQVWCDYDSDEARISIMVTRRGVEVQSHRVVTVLPGDVWIREAVWKLVWKSERKVRMVSADGSQNWDVEIAAQGKPA